MTHQFNHINLSNNPVIDAIAFIKQGGLKGNNWLNKRSNGTIDKLDFDIRHF